MLEDLSAVAPWAGIIIGNTVVVALAVKRMNAERDEKAEKHRTKLRDELTVAISRVDAEAGTAIRRLNEELTAHRVEDAGKYATRDEMAGALKDVHAELGAINNSLRALVRVGT